MLTIACVYRKSGSTYSNEWVYKLQRGIARNITIPYNFVCLTNLSNEQLPGVTILPLTEKFPHWWSKIELFKPKQFSGRVLYFDIDSLICGNIDNIANYNSNNLIMLRDCPKFPHVTNSSLMAWDSSNSIYENIFYDFKKNQWTIMQDYYGKLGVEHYGDQGFINDVMKKNNHIPERWQEVLPYQWFLEFSYLDRINPLVADGNYNKDARVSYCLGYPKFNNLPQLDLVSRHWI